MREIEFRGKTKDGVWVQGDFIAPSDICVEILNLKSVLRETVGQFTGARDKKGNKIFEGDIVKNVFEEGNDELLLVVWDENFMRFELEEIKTKERVDLLAREDAEIIGNRFDNAELLKVA